VNANTHTWCDFCEDVRPILEAEMGGDDVSGKFTNATDLLCGECRLVIATTYTPKSVNKTNSSEGK
jgi:hypothetical protein